MTVQRPFKNAAISSQEEICNFIKELSEHLQIPALNRLQISAYDDDEEDKALNIVLKNGTSTTTWFVLFRENVSSVLIKETSEQTIKIVDRGLSKTKTETITQDNWETKPTKEFKHYILEFLYEKMSATEQQEFARFITKEFPGASLWSRTPSGRGHRSRFPAFSTK